MKPVLSQFRTEIRHFCIVSLFNLVFAALAIAFGAMYVIAAVTGLTADLAGPWLRIITGAIAMVCFGLGLSWLLSTLKVFEGVEAIKDNLDREDDISDNRITCLIMQMLVHYRNNRRTIDTLIRVCALGGICFFILGIATSLQALSFTPDGFIVYPEQLPGHPGHAPRARDRPCKPALVVLFLKICERLGTATP